ncbi:phage tail assembly chaperone [Herbaspirillum seropedicae]|uniref:phage tail assembly chaperone n=1 Tax=Herbaspirillum seropedicae TaxID=964 RepID=UPI003FCE885D
MKKLKLNPNPTFLLPVAVPVPGEAAPTEIKLVVKYRNLDELQVFATELSEKPLDQAINEIVTDWEGVDEDFSADALAKLLKNYPSVNSVILEAYFLESHKARRKN